MIAAYVKMPCILVYVFIQIVKYVNPGQKFRQFMFKGSLNQLWLASLDPGQSILMEGPINVNKLFFFAESWPQLIRRCPPSSWSWLGMEVLAKLHSSNAI